MADSDEESDRKKRDKFRKERNDYNERRRSDHHDRKPSWREEYYEARRRSREEENGRSGDRSHHSRGSPPSGGRRHDWSPPDTKRFRRGGPGWESLRDAPMMTSPFGMMDHRGPPPWVLHGDFPSRGSHMSPGSRSLPGDMMMGFSPMSPDSRSRGNSLLSFKQFLSQQDDSIDDTEAVKLYQEYKADFKKKQLHQFFNDHKEEDWFLSKYHPKYIEKCEETNREHITKRIEVFKRLSDKLQHVPLSHEESDSIVRVMDSTVIYLEGGNELDLKSLEKREEEEEERGEEEKGEEERAKEDNNKGDHQESVDIEGEGEERRGIKRTREEEEGADEIISSKKKNEEEEESIDLEIPPTVQDKEMTDPPQEEKEKSDTTDSIPPETHTNTTPTETQTNTTTPTETHSDTTETETKTETDTIETHTPTETHTHTTPTAEAHSDTTNTGESESKVEEMPIDAPSTKPRPLHLTKAVYIRHVTPQISVNDILEVCKGFPGFLRIGLAEPQPERGFERRGWLTFSNDVNIKEMSVKIGTRKIKNTVLTCQVNRDLSRRVKTCSPITWARRAVESDVKLLQKLIDFFDKKFHLWTYAKNKGDEEEGETELNPVIAILNKGMTDSNIEEDSVGGVSKGAEEGEDEEGLIEDPGTEILKLGSPLVQTLDMLVWYMRLIHSFDYYNGTVFTDEDTMPHRCGIMTARPHPPNAVTNEEVNEYIKSAETRVEPLLKEKTFLEGEELEKLGKRDHDSEVEKFIEVNTQKLGENKYLCPLSGKKFRGPEFVRKHIMNKHSHALEEVKSEADFFNNYLKDPDRPVPLDPIAGGGGDEERRGGPRGGRMWGGDHMMVQGYPEMRRGGRGRPFRGGGGFRGSDRRGGGRRPVRSYNDLDMPDDMY